MVCCASGYDSFRWPPCLCVLECCIWQQLKVILMALAIFMYVSFFVIGLGLIVGFPMYRWYQITHSDDSDQIDDHFDAINLDELDDDELDKLEELLRSNK